MIIEKHWNKILIMAPYWHNLGPRIILVVRIKGKKEGKLKKDGLHNCFSNKKGN